MFKHIFVAVDGSECSLQAMKVAAGLAKEQGSQCTVCSVVDIVRAASSMAFAYGDIVDAWIKELQREAHEVVTSAQASVADLGVSLGETVVEGYPADAIVDTASSAHADLIVMGSHGRSGFRRLFLGSVAESVLRLSPVPVLIVKEQQSP